MGKFAELVFKAQMGFTLMFFVPLFLSVFYAIPAYIFWNWLAPVYFYWLPEVYQQIPFWHIWGLFCLMPMVKSLVLPNQIKNEVKAD